ncbi:hypothetical protein AMS68_005016 [Peltaster fructicola]|uniref:Uncharacterized protein n=1 Tax=Peltaster fructicola TaxID=286661 RepID=A0A6H0XY03_9PEZI|nr:hypothetical protein AMS68_005016 [Peltaster fructicola]
MASIRAPPSHFTVLYFASASSYAKKPSGGHDFLRAPILATSLFDALETLYPGMKEKVLSSCLLNIDDEYIDLDEEAQKGEQGMMIQAGSIVVIVPPVSAG